MLYYRSSLPVFVSSMKLLSSCCVINTYIYIYIILLLVSWRPTVRACWRLSDIYINEDQIVVGSHWRKPFSVFATTTIENKISRKYVFFADSLCQLAFLSSVVVTFIVTAHSLLFSDWGIWNLMDKLYVDTIRLVAEILYLSDGNKKPVLGSLQSLTHWAKCFESFI